MFPSRLNEAIGIATTSRYRDRRCYSLAAIGVRNDTIVRATNILSFAIEPRAHAESRCLRKMQVGGSLFVARVRRDGSIGCARPCGECQMQLRFKKVKCVYTISGEEYGVIDV
jgi:cytidine deaminase